ncbi:antiviral reverse transcriptase Drt3b [Shewanella algae]|uniref:antiviral reverse transcriptase Drt3b n=1 Tax=Shewanella algae TaxID=38313 RepID=UPI0031F4D90B
MRKVINIKLKKERAILSDVLPYETPITFSNRFFYDFLLQNNVACDSKKIAWKSCSNADEAVIHLLFGLDSKQIQSVRNVGDKKYFSFPNGTFITIPFQYGISHKDDRYRKLSVIHPRNQVQMIGFYDQFKELIVFFSEKSKFSLRHPSRIANSRIYDDERKSASVMLSNKLDKNIAYRNKDLKSFFGYQKIRNIHEFFESKVYHECEKKYDLMAQLDISKFFDSIYTHSITWAVLGKKIIKDHIANISIDVIAASFGQEFDTLMQKQNYNETNGIVIGPELSRIFAEIILQKIDCNLELLLTKSNIIFNKHYAIFRYVDDFFVFFNDECVYKEIVNSLTSCLSEYKLSLNTEKELIYSKPIITEITMAKRKISDLLDQKLMLNIEDVEDALDLSADKKKVGRIKIHGKSLITLFKSILAESGAEYKSVINYTFTIIESKIKDILDKYCTLDYSYNLKKSLISSIESVVEFCFFIYNVAPRVNTSIKLCRVLKLVVEFCKSKQVNQDEMHHLFKLIFDNLSFVIEKYDSKNYTQVETLYLLTVMSELGRDYRLSELELIRYFGGSYSTPRTIQFDHDLNYFSITVILFYIGNKKRYERVRKAVKRQIKAKLLSPNTHKTKDSEAFLLLMDCISCPYLEVGFKKSLLSHYGISNSRLQSEVVALKDNWFTKWKDFSFAEELDSKQSDEVY